MGFAVFGVWGFGFFGGLGILVFGTFGELGFWGLGFFLMGFGVFLWDLQYFNGTWDFFMVWELEGLGFWDLWFLAFTGIWDFLGFRDSWVFCGLGGFGFFF